MNEKVNQSFNPLIDKHSGFGSVLHYLRLHHLYEPHPLMLHSSSHLLFIGRLACTAATPLGSMWGISGCPIVCNSVGDSKVNVSLIFGARSIRKGLTSSWSFSQSSWTITSVGTSAQSSTTCTLKTLFGWNGRLSPQNYRDVLVSSGPQPSLLSIVIFRYTSYELGTISFGINSWRSISLLLTSCLFPVCSGWAQLC